ncbi:LCP family protein required for cell wall assembly [Pullulanibacillus pueri]|uniref:Transcriptional regulator LytR n=1 Tax=Pullulanibacillus pueri TaxID=1437324 RepID=A0A8J2ZZL2_9BACL|nr:LCP family protein [Pullulanibacillus pueri]MBM7684104.1 LCP family protein required for cell wall assembly [Pullulanibacillus pueri]GGH88666.1 transcriptional regulator LytR [Pullulanibacillus pueri]
MRSQRSKPKSKLKRFFLIAGIVLGILIVAVGGYGFYIFHSVSKTADKMYNPLKGVKNEDLPLVKNKKSATPINILILGVDERKGDKGRSDTMIVASLNPSTNSMLMTSIPRDTRVQIPGRSGYSKINAAYAYGDEELAVKTVEKYLNIDIPYYVKMNMEGLADLVDAVGGITVNNDIQWTDEGFYKKGYVYKKGQIYLDGPKAMGFVRMRHEDNRGDFGRNLRQREVIQGILHKGKSFTSVTKIDNVLDVLGGNVTTNLSFDDMKRLATDYRTCQQNIKDYEVKGTTGTIDKISWVLVSDEEFQNVHNKIENQLASK